MNDTGASIRSTARYLLLWLAIIALLMMALTVTSQGSSESTASNSGPWANSLNVLPVVRSSDHVQWTFLVYLDGDNNLENAGIDDFLEMSSVGSTSDVNIVVQFDRVPGYTSGYDDWRTTKRFLVTHGMTPTSDNALQDIGEANMGDPQTLVDFVQWGMTHYPADHYAVVLWDHGSGWQSRSDEAPPLKYIAYDETNGGDTIDMPELRSAMDTLSNGGSEPIDLVGFDACLMGMIEVDNQLIPYADVRVGSEETEPGDGWPFDTILSSLTGNPAMSASQLGTVIVDEYYVSYGNGWTQSAIDLQTPYASLNAAVNDFAVALSDGVSDHYTEIASARNRTQEFYYLTYIDLYDFAYEINLHVNNVTISTTATAVMNAINTTVIREQHGESWPGTHGISIYFPESLGDYDSNYDGSTGWLQFTANTQWDEWLHAFYNHHSTCADPHEPNDTPWAATSIAYGTTLSDPDICQAGDLDYYAFTGSAGDSIVADIDAQIVGSALDSYLHLYDADGITELAGNDDYGGLDSYIAHTLPADGTYYLMVREYNHPHEGGPDYFYTISLAKVFDIDAKWGPSAPTIDGQIAPGEWDDAATYDITNSSTSQKPRTIPVTLYVMNDGSHLYLAIDNPNDTTMDTHDQMGVYFDDNPLPSDGRWTNTGCGHPDGEGNFWVRSGSVDYREGIAGPVFCDVVNPAPGVSGSVGHGSGHAQTEIAVDLTSSALRAVPGDTINMYLWIFDHHTTSFDGKWPSTADDEDPSTYRHLTLATCTMPATPTLSSPPDKEPISDNPPTFSWGSVSGATSYHIQAGDAPGFSSPEINEIISNTSYTPSSALLDGSSYYWRVQASNFCGSGAWSAVWEFTTPAKSPEPMTYLPIVTRDISSQNVWAIPCGCH